MHKMSHTVESRKERPQKVSKRNYARENYARCTTKSQLPASCVPPLFEISSDLVSVRDLVLRLQDFQDGGVSGAVLGVSVVGEGLGVPCFGEADGGGGVDVLEVVVFAVGCGEGPVEAGGVGEGREEPGKEEGEEEEVGAGVGGFGEGEGRHGGVRGGGEGRAGKEEGG